MRAAISLPYYRASRIRAGRRRERCPPASTSSMGFGHYRLSRPSIPCHRFIPTTTFIDGFFRRTRRMTCRQRAEHFRARCHARLYFIGRRGAATRRRMPHLPRASIAGFISREHGRASASADEYAPQCGGVTISPPLGITRWRFHAQASRRWLHFIITHAGRRRYRRDTARRPAPRRNGYRREVDDIITYAHFRARTALPRPEPLAASRPQERDS